METRVLPEDELMPQRGPREQFLHVSTCWQVCLVGYLSVDSRDIVPMTTVKTIVRTNRSM